MKSGKMKKKYTEMNNVVLTPKTNLKELSGKCKVRQAELSFRQSTARVNGSIKSFSHTFN